MARSFQLVNIFPGLTVAETLAVAVVSRLGRGLRLWALLARDTEVRARVEAVADLFALSPKLGLPARALSQGDKKLLDVASAFALGPQIILLDEPTSGVSTREKTAIMETLVTAARQTGIKAIIQVEHDMDIVFGYSDRIIALHQGRCGRRDARRDPRRRARGGHGHRPEPPHTLAPEGGEGRVRGRR
jgi:branched-chain amino acid transport system ATP-binding protein